MHQVTVPHKGLTKVAKYDEPVWRDDNQYILLLELRIMHDSRRSGVDRTNVCGVALAIEIMVFIASSETVREVKFSHSDVALGQI